MGSRATKLQSLSRCGARVVIATSQPILVVPTLLAEFISRVYVNLAQSRALFIRSSSFYIGRSNKPQTILEVGSIVVKFEKMGRLTAFRV